MSSVLRADNAGKKFSKTLRQMMLYGARDIVAGSLGFRPRESLRAGEFWAVDGVSFDVQKGESFGIIGPNGSGKTTLLRMLNGIFMPDKGRIEVKGRVGGLIHVGAGFHPMLTGRENIFVNGAILGMSRKMIQAKFDSIVSFSGIGDFLDSPVKQYSSGMYVRLGFAIAAHSEPDILLVDEVLAVGDREFSMRCYRKMKEIRESGTTILLVSHNEYVIRERTSRCLYLRNGKPQFLGPSDEAISLYIRHSLESKSLQAEPGSTAVQPFKAQIVSFGFKGEDGASVEFVKTGCPLKAELVVRVHEHIEKPVFGVNFYSDQGLVYAANSDYEQQRLEPMGPGEYSLELSWPAFYLPSDKYFITPVVAEGNAADLIDCRHMSHELVVGRAENSRGNLKLPVTWRTFPRSGI